jgi:hypothetical protein
MSREVGGGGEREEGGGGEREEGREGEAELDADEKLAKDTGVHIWRGKKKGANKKLVWYLLDHGADPTFNDPTSLCCLSELAEDPSIVLLLRFYRLLLLHYCLLCACACIQVYMDMCMCAYMCIFLVYVSRPVLLSLLLSLLQSLRSMRYADRCLY